MLSTMSELGVPYVMQHIRGDSSTMQNKTNTTYDHIIRDVKCENKSQWHKSQIPIWNLYNDCGIGFSKTQDQCWDLCRNHNHTKVLEHQISVAGPSRKSFLKNCGLESNV
eukprot:UN26635